LGASDKEKILSADKFYIWMPWAGNMYWIQQDTIVDIPQLNEQLQIALRRGINSQISHQKDEL